MQNPMSGSGRRLAAAVVLGAASAAIAASGAHADGITKAHVDGKLQEAASVHMSGGVNADTGLIPLLPDHGTDLMTYCIQMGVDAVGAEYHEADWTAEGTAIGIDKADLEAIKWILNHSYPTLTPQALRTAAGIKDPLTPNEAAAGTQAAIWSFSGKSQLDEVSEDKDDHNITLIYKYLVGEAAKHTGDQSLPPASLSLLPLKPAGAVHPGDKVGFQVLSSDTTEAFIALKLTGTAGAKLVDEKGSALPAGAVFKSGTKVYVQIPATPTSGTATVEVSGTVNGIEAGRVFIPEVSGSSQNLILAQPSNQPVTATAKVAWTPAVVTPPSSSSSHSSAPSSKPSSTPSSQPSTAPSGTPSTTARLAPAATHPSTTHTTSSTHTPTPTPTPTSTSTTTTDTTSTPSTDLARTGAGDTAIYTAGALVLVAVGGGMVVYTRRKQTS